ncbi:hypothetical protein B5X24_HaOG202812 [Helicoverpa armigera]|nr:hypothetical protein B5X24_HaOG202812 [Helicoverpa armigera]
MPSPARVQSSSELRASQSCRAALQVTYESRDRASIRSLPSITYTSLFSTGTNSSVHMVHLVDIFRSAKVEYPPPVIIKVLRRYFRSLTSLVL